MLKNFSNQGSLELNYSEFIECEFRSNNHDKTIRLMELTNVWIPSGNIASLIDDLEGANYITHQSRYSLHSFSDDAYISFRRNSYGLYECSIYHTTKVALAGLIAIVEKNSDSTKKLHINWFSSKDGSYEEIIDVSSYVTKESIYPFVPGGVKNYVDGFLNSDASIIILIGEPGTGKTNFIRYMLYQMEKEVFLSYDENILKKDDIFISFVADSNAGAFVIEDADLLLKSRKVGNDIMSKLLNVGDGLIRLNGKKLIFSTNLESVSDIDPAIMRPGRCYDALKFRKLTLKEANAVCDDYSLENLVENKDYTLAEIFTRRKKTYERKFGFV